jgi:hypothetical protein
MSPQPQAVPGVIELRACSTQNSKMRRGDGLPWPLAGGGEGGWGGGSPAGRGCRDGPATPGHPVVQPVCRAARCAPHAVAQHAACRALRLPPRAGARVRGSCAQRPTETC